MSARLQPWPESPGSSDLAVLLAAVEAFPESLAIVESGLVLYANPAWARMFESAIPQSRRRMLEDFIPRGSPHVVLRAGSGNQNIKTPRSRFARVRKDGAELQLQVGTRGFRGEHREFQVVSTRDVSRQEQTRRRLLQSTGLEAAGRLVGAVAHDFNNLLTGIMLHCDLLMSELEKESRSHQHALTMRRAGEQGSLLVQQLLTLIRPQARRSRMAGLNEAISAVQDLLTRLIGENIVMNTSLGGGVGAVSLDPAQIQQILLNLVLNARDAMPRGGRITVVTRNCPHGLPSPAEPQPGLLPDMELVVADTGCGMDIATLRHAFDPFFTTKKEGRGTGLGLATVRGLVEQEGGTIEVESAPGRGTRVSVRLPRILRNSASHSRLKR